MIDINFPSIYFLTMSLISKVREDNLKPLQLALRSLTQHGQNEESPQRCFGFPDLAE